MSSSMLKICHGAWVAYYFWWIIVY